jgi:hypothetical protein
MAEQPPISALLENISKIEVYETYEPQIGKYLFLIRSFAHSLLTLNPDTLLPPDRPNPYQNRGDQGTIREQVTQAYQITNALLSVLGVLSPMPAKNDLFSRQIENFLSQAAAFMRIWSVLVPALHAAAGGDQFERVRTALSEAEANSEKVKTILADTQETAKKIGAGKHAGVFFDLSMKYRRWAGVAIGMTVLTALIFVSTVAVALYLTWRRVLYIPKDDYGLFAQLIIGKVLVLGVVYYLMVLAARSYRANRHLAAVNLHRATALQTFQTFADSPSDDQTKNAVLLETTRCIYSLTNTGFLGGEEVSSPVQIIEILKALGPGKSH